MSKILVPRIGLVTRNTTVKYESFSTQFSEFVSKVKVSERITE